MCPVSYSNLGIKRDIDLVSRYVDLCAARMKLGHWTITCTDGGNSDPYAEVTRTGSCTALIEFYTGFWRSHSDMKRITVAHELVHLHTWSLAELVPDTHAEAREEVEERLVDTIAEIVAEMLPSWRGRNWRR